MMSFFPVDCSATLQRIGLLIKANRLAQNIRQLDVVSRLGVPEKVLRRIEKGDPSVNVGAWMLVLWNLGLMDQVFRPADETSISVLALKEDTTGRRARVRRAKAEDF